MKSKTLFLFILTLWGGLYQAHAQHKKGGIEINTTQGHPIEEGMSGFNVRIADKVWDYSHPDFLQAVELLQPGWLRYFSGTMGDAFNSATGQYDLDYIRMFNHQKEYLNAYKFSEVKGPQSVAQLYEVLGNVGGKLVITVNAFTETPEIVEALCHFVKNNNIEVALWQFCNEPYFYIPERGRYWWNNGYDYAQKMKPYADVIRTVFPEAQIALNCTWDGIWGFMKQIHQYQQEHGAYWNTFSKHSYAPHTGKQETFEQARKRANTRLIEVTSPEAMQEIEDYQWESVPMYITEFGLWNRPLNGNYSSIYYVEYTLRQLQHTNTALIASHEISSKILPAQRRNQDLLDAYEKGEKIQTADLETGIRWHADGQSLALLHEVTNHSSFTYDARLFGDLQAEGLKNTQEMAWYARGFKGNDGHEYIVVCNRSKENIDFEVIWNGKKLKDTVLTQKELYADTADQVVLDAPKTFQTTADQVQIRPYSVTILQWESKEHRTLSPSRIYHSKVVADGILLKWWKKASATKYTLYYGTDKDKLTHQIEIKGAENNHYVFQKAQTGKPYYFAITSSNQYGESEPSKLVHLHYEVPQTPEIFKVARRDSIFTLYWHSVPEALGYKVILEKAHGKEIIDVKNVFGYKTQPHAYDELINVSVCAYNGLGQSMPSTPKTVILKPNIPVPARNISATRGQDGSVFLAWESDAPKGTKYKILRGRQPHQFEVVATDIEALSYNDTDKTEEKFYTVLSYNADGQADYYPNIATVIEPKVNMSVASITEDKDYFYITVVVPTLKHDRLQKVGIAISDVSYLTVEEETFEQEGTKANEYTFEVPKSILKGKHKYSVKAYVKTQKLKAFSLPPYQTFGIKATAK